VRRRNDKLPTLLGADMGNATLDPYTARQFLLSFNAAQVPISWRDTQSAEKNSDASWATTDLQIEWCKANGVKVVAGPLVMLDPRFLSEWFYLFEDDFESVQEFVSNFTKAAVERYRGSVDYWLCAARVNSSTVLSETERLQLVANVIEQIHTLDPSTPILMSVDQPWAEYLRQCDSDFPPLQFADTLVRANLGLSGLMLEMNVGYTPGGTLLRPPLEFNRMLDNWALFGLPLWLSLSAPSAYHDDPLAQHKIPMAPGYWTKASQKAWVSRYVSLAMAKPLVQGILWNQLHDSRPHVFPHGGLFDDRRQAKPALRTLAALRQTNLQ
jgi:hypothetical protein